MATDLAKTTQSKSKYHNWIKAALAVLFTKEAIEPVVYNEILHFQKKCLQDIATSNSLSTGSTCNTCCTENLVSCPTNRLCNVRRRKCSYHKGATTQYLPSGCPNKICHNLKTEIQNAHRYNGPSFQNTDATQWCSNPWEIAKCYMPPDGYRDVPNAAETDFNGISSVMINHKGFDSKISDNLSKKNNIFEQGREVGKAVRHSPNLEVEDADLTKYFTILSNILNDPRFVAISKSQKNASQKLTQLQTDELIIGKDVVCKALHDIGNAMQEQIKEEVSMYKHVTKEHKTKLLDTVDQKIKEIEIQGDISVAQLSEKLKTSFDNFKIFVHESVQEIKDQIRRGKEEIVKEKEQALKEIKDCKSTADVYDGVNRTVVTEEEMYEKGKKELKKRLTKFYKNKRSTIPLSPLVEERDTPLAGFYVMPNMVTVRQKSHTSDQEERTQISSLSELFITESEDQQEIYLTADAGFGKTSLSKYLAITWSQAFRPDKNRDCFKDEEISALANFEFLFLILLRDSIAVCSIDEMIEQQIIKKLPNSKLQYPLQKVLDKEKCLIILDGLDEWAHPNNGCTDQKEKIPHRYARDNCVILTTTRPWKLGSVNLKLSDINKKVELVRLSVNSIHQLEENAISKMSGVKDDYELKEKVWELDDILASRGLQYMQTVPLLLMYITCLWCNNIPIGNSKVDVYSSVIEFLLSRTVQKHPGVHTCSEPSKSDIPDYLKTHKFCQKFYSVLTALAELAYHTLFSEKRENTLVFDGFVAEKYLKIDDMKLCLLSGILTESTITTLVERKSKVSFSHKTVQEFFVAIFISSHSNTQETVLEKCENVQSILDMSMICEFLSKMNSKVMFEILSGSLSKINEDEETRDFRNMTGYVNRYIVSEPLYNIQKMFLSCSKEMAESENIKLHLQDFFIDEDTIHDKSLQRLSKLNQTNMKSFYINMWHTFSSLQEIINLFSITDLNNLQKLYYDGGVKEADISVLLFPCLQTVTLSSVKLTKYEGKFCEKLEKLKNVKYLDISEIRLSHEILEIFFNILSSNKTIKELRLSGLSCKEHREDCLMKLDLSKISWLKKLEMEWLPSLQLNLTTSSLVYVMLEFISLDESSLLLSRDMLNIAHVKLGDMQISAVSFREFIKVLEDLPQSVTVAMRGCNIKPETKAKRVRNNIGSSQTFVVTHDNWPGRFEFHTRKRQFHQIKNENKKCCIIN